MPHAFTIDTGMVIYTVISTSAYADSTRWQIFGRRNFTRTRYGIPNPWSVKDSSIFEIVESHQGRHELYTPAWNQWGAFPFRKSEADSLRFFRYLTTDTSGNATLQINFPTGELQPLAYTYNVRRGTGILKVSGGIGYISGWTSARHHLREFWMPFPDPHLVLIQPNITLQTLFGQGIDSALSIRNDGVEPLLISNITVSDSRFTITGWSGMLPPLTIGSIGLRFDSPTPDTILAFLVVQSNSTTSPDTMTIRAEAIAAPSVSLSASSIDFGVVLGGAIRRKAVTLTNTGNTSLILDSAWINRLEGIVGQFPGPIAPQQSDSLTLSFAAPMYSTSWSGTAFIHSNAFNSPSLVYLLAVSVARGNIRVSSAATNFGTVAVGASKDTVISIENLSDDGTDFRRIVLASSSPFIFLNAHDPSFLNPFGVFQDTIRFAPVQSGSFVDTILYQTLRWSTVTRSDTAVLFGRTPEELPTRTILHQNFPNPFNSSTTIMFDNAGPAHVAIKVYDMLGREVGTIVNEEMKPGHYEKIFDPVGLASGVYIYRLQAGGYGESKKLLILR